MTDEQKDEIDEAVAEALEQGFLEKVQDLPEAKYRLTEKGRKMVENMGKATDGL